MPTALAAPKPVSEQKAQPLYYGHGSMSVCCPSNFSDAQVIAFAQADYPADPEKRWSIASVVRVPCDVRRGCVHLSLREGA